MDLVVILLLFRDLYFGSRRTRLCSERPSGILIWTLLEFLAKENSTGLPLIFKALWNLVFILILCTSNGEHQVVGGAYRGWGRGRSGRHVVRKAFSGPHVFLKWCWKDISVRWWKELYWNGRKRGLHRRKMQRLDSFGVDQLFIHAVYINPQR